MDQRVTPLWQRNVVLMERMANISWKEQSENVYFIDFFGKNNSYLQEIYSSLKIFHVSIEGNIIFCGHIKFEIYNIENIETRVGNRTGL
jgi:hypothetical protein